jgi:hypothetical protein
LLNFNPELTRIQYRYKTEKDSSQHLFLYSIIPVFKSHRLKKVLFKRSPVPFNRSFIVGFSSPTLAVVYRFHSYFNSSLILSKLCLCLMIFSRITLQSFSLKSIPSSLCLKNSLPFSSFSKTA